MFAVQAYIKLERIFNNGIFSRHDETKNIIIKAGEGFHWRDGETDKDERTFIEIVLKIEESIIGYTVVEIYRNSNSNFYKAKLLKAALFPKVDNEYQQVSQEEIKTAIELAKKVE